MIPIIVLGDIRRFAVIVAGTYYEFVLVSLCLLLLVKIVNRIDVPLSATGLYFIMGLIVFSVIKGVPSSVISITILQSLAVISIALKKTPVRNLLIRITLFNLVIVFLQILWPNVMLEDSAYRFQFRLPGMFPAPGIHSLFMVMISVYFLLERNKLFFILSSVSGLTTGNRSFIIFFALCMSVLILISVFKLSIVGILFTTLFLVAFLKVKDTFQMQEVLSRFDYTILMNDFNTRYDGSAGFIDALELLPRSPILGTGYWKDGAIRYQDDLGKFRTVNNGFVGTMIFIGLWSIYPLRQCARIMSKMMINDFSLFLALIIFLFWNIFDNALLSPIALFFLLRTKNQYSHEY